MGLAAPCTVERGTLSPRTIINYAAIGLVTKALTLPLVSYLPPAYAQATGLSLATVGILFMVARLWDIFLDPVAGYLIDRFSPPFGPRKFWILVAACILCLTIPPVFSPRFFGLGQGGHIAGPAVMLLIFYFGWTMMAVTHAAWPAELAATGTNRARLVGWREWAGVVGMVGIVSTPAIAQHFGYRTLEDQLTIMGGFALSVLPIAVVLSFFLPAWKKREVARPDPLAVIKLLSSSAHLRKLLLADFFSGSGFAISSATSFFIVSWLGLAASFSTLMLAYFIGMIIGIPLFLKITIRLGMRNSFSMAMIGAALAMLALAAVPYGAIGIALCFQFGIGLCTGGYQSNLNAQMVQIAEAHAHKTGRASIGSHFALLALTNKMGYALAIGICYPLLGALGFHAGKGLPAHSGLILSIIGLGGAAMFLCLGAFCFPTKNTNHLHGC